MLFLSLVSVSVCVFVCLSACVFYVSFSLFICLSICGQVPAGVHRTEVLVHLDRLPVFCQQISQTIRAQTVGKAATFSKVGEIIIQHYLNLWMVQVQDKGNCRFGYSIYHGLLLQCKNRKGSCCQMLSILSHS